MRTLLCLAGMGASLFVACLYALCCAGGKADEVSERIAALVKVEKDE